MLRPDFPGYFPTMLVAVRSNSVAPSSVQMALRSMDLPHPSGPTISTDLMAGVFSRSSGEPRGRMQYSVISLHAHIRHCIARYRNSPSHICGARGRLHPPGLKLRPSVGDVANVLLETDLGVELDHVVHNQLLEERLRGPIRSQILVLLFFSFLASFLSLLPLLANLSLLTFVSLNSLMENYSEL